jgi:hypothetical protein
LAHFIGRLAGAGPLAWAVLALGIGAAVLMVLTEFSTIQSVRIGESTCGAADNDVRDLCQTTGGDAHGWSLIALAVLTGLLAFGAAAGRSRPAAYALMAIGVVVVGIALILDHPKLNDTRGLETRYSQVKAQTGGGYTLEFIAAGLALGAGGLALARERLAPRALGPRRRGDAEASEADAAGSET